MHVTHGFGVVILGDHVSSIVVVRVVGKVVLLLVRVVWTVQWPYRLISQGAGNYVLGLQASIGVMKVSLVWKHD